MNPCQYCGRTKEIVKSTLGFPDYTNPHNPDECIANLRADLAAANKRAEETAQQIAAALEIQAEERESKRIAQQQLAQERAEHEQTRKDELETERICDQYKEELQTALDSYCRSLKHETERREQAERELTAMQTARDSATELLRVVREQRDAATAKVEALRGLLRPNNPEFYKDAPDCQRCNGSMEANEGCDFEGDGPFYCDECAQELLGKVLEALNATVTP